MSRRALAALAALALAMRLAYLIRYDEDIDALRFALAVDRFDVGELRPHAPFYPVYVALAKGVAALGASPQIALGVVGAVSGAIVVVATTLLAFEVGGRGAAQLAGVLALASPFLWLSSEKLTSDAAGAALTTTALWLCERARRRAEAGRTEQARIDRTLALGVFGIELGVRLSYFPFALAALGAIAIAEGGGRAWLLRARDLAAGVVVWLVPLVVVAGPRALVAVSVRQAIGHFTRWGGSVITVPSPAERAHGMLWGTWANALGGAWPDAPAARWLGAPALLAVVLLALGRMRGAAVSRHPELWAAALGYAAWAALFQNVAYKPRHLLPLLPLAIVALAVAAAPVCARSRAALAACALLAAQWLVDGAALVREHVAPSPAAAVVRHLASSGDASPVVSRELARMIEEGAPGRRVIGATEDPAAAVVAAGGAGVLITSEALSPQAAAALASRGLAARISFARPRSRYVDALWSDLALLEVVPRAP